MIGLETSSVQDIAKLRLNKNLLIEIDKTLEEFNVTILGRLKKDENIEVIFQVRVGVIPPISRYRENELKNEAKPSFFNEFRGM